MASSIDKINIQLLLIPTSKIDTMSERLSKRMNLNCINFNLAYVQFTTFCLKLSDL